MLNMEPAHIIIIFLAWAKALTQNYLSSNFCCPGWNRVSNIFLIIFMNLLTTTSHLWHQRWLIFWSTSLCVFTLLDQSSCNVWPVWRCLLLDHLISPYFEGSHFCIAWTFLTDFVYVPWTLCYLVVKFVLFWIILWMIGYLRLCNFTREQLYAGQDHWIHCIFELINIFWK